MRDVDALDVEGGDFAGQESGEEEGDAACACAEVQNGEVLVGRRVGFEEVS